jgi:hypothetical protein
MTSMMMKLKTNLYRSHALLRVTIKSQLLPVP